jgi:hypothetical protein
MKSIEIEPIWTNIYFNWSADNGFGQLSVEDIDRKLSCSNECLSKESVRALLHAWADYVADNCELQDKPFAER